MDLASAKHQITQNHPDIQPEVQRNVFEALDTLESILGLFETAHIEKLYDMERNNSIYFPRLSVAAAKTMKDLREVNPSLSLDFILETADELADRGRPWQSLGAFSELGKHCGRAMTESNIRYLMRISSDVLEIIGFSIRNKMSSNKSEDFSYTIKHIENFDDNPDLVAALKEIFSKKQVRPAAKTSTAIEWHILNGFIVALGVAAVALALTAPTTINFGAAAVIAFIGCGLVRFGFWQTAQSKETTRNALDLQPS